MLLIMQLLVALTDYLATRSSTKLAKILVFKLLLTVSVQLCTRIVSPAITAKILSAKPKSHSGLSKLHAHKSSLNWAMLEQPSLGQQILKVKLLSEFLIARVPLPSMSASRTHRAAWT